MQIIDCYFNQPVRSWVSDPCRKEEVQNCQKAGKSEHWSHGQTLNYGT